MKRIALIGLAVVVLGTAALGFGALWTWEAYVEGPIGPPDESLVFNIPEGTGFNLLGEMLSSRGLVAKPEWFKLYVKLNPPTAPLQAGEYELSGAMRPQDLIDRVTSGEVVLYPVTIPEGLTVREIAAAIERAGLASADAVMAVATDVRFIGSVDIPAEHLEGYLFPETYHFARGTKPEAIVRAMVDAFDHAFNESMERRAEQIGLTKHEVVTLASIIEKETGQADERPRISAVFHNRLKKKMRLQTDPTVIYGIANFDGNLTRKHLTTETPYNTYMIRGLPPGPIASPGRESLRAALYPAEDPALYFVSRNDGSHVFSKTLEAHNRAVDQYQRRRATR